VDVRFDAHNGLKLDIAPCPKSANSRSCYLCPTLINYQTASCIAFAPRLCKRIHYSRQKVIVDPKAP
jgi:hypothetical protein